MSDDQQHLLDQLLETHEYEVALQLLLDHAHLIDDEFLGVLVALSQMQFGEERYDQALVIADLGIQAAHKAGAEVRIDLHCAAANAEIKRGIVPSAIFFLEQAQAIASEAKTVYHLPFVLCMLGQVLHREKSPKGLELLRSAARVAQVKDTALSDEEYLQILMVYGNGLRDAGMGDELAVESLLSCVAARNLARVRTILGNLSDLERVWATARIKETVALDDDYDWEPFDILRAIGTEAREHATPPLHDRPSTNVVMDRVIGLLPLRPMYLTLDALSGDLDGVAILAHEFAHSFSMSGCLGRYFSLMAAVLYGYEAILTKGQIAFRGTDDGRLHIVAANPAEAPMLRHFAAAQAKYESFWLLWQPWLEGLAVFGELDVALEPQEDDWLLPISMLLLGIPKIAYEAGDEGQLIPLAGTSSEGGSTHLSVDSLVSTVRDLLNAARRHRIERGILANIFLDPRSDGNEDAYFLGYAFIRALWRRWASNCADFRSPARFFNTLTWLTLSSLDDLIPNAEARPSEFFEQLASRFASFLDALIAVPGSLLERVGTEERIESIQHGAFDLWHFIQTVGNVVPTAELAGKRTDELQRELSADADQAAPEQRAFLDDAVNTLLTFMLRPDMLHLLSRSTVAFRLNGHNRSLYVAGRSAASGSTGAWIWSLLDDDYEALLTSCDEESRGLAVLSQVLLSEPHPEMGRRYSAITVFQHGETALIWSKYGAPVEETLRHIILSFLGPKLQRTRKQIIRSATAASADRATIAAALPTDEGVAAIQTLIRSVPDRVVDLYLRPLLGTEAALLDRVRARRMRGLLSPDLLEQDRQSKILRAIAHAPDGVAVEDIAETMKVSRDDMLAELMRIVDYGRRSGQSLIAFDDNRWYFIGLTIPDRGAVHNTKGN